MVTLVDILDTAVKVGLGALIGGFTTYWVTRLNHAKDIEKEYIRGRRKTLEDIASFCDNFAHQAQNYWALIADWVEYEFPETDHSDAKRKGIEESSQRFYDAFHELTSAEGKLPLLGETDTHIELREYGSYVQEFFAKAHVNNTELTLEKLEEDKSSMREKRLKLLLSLSEVYTRRDA